MRKYTFLFILFLSFPPSLYAESLELGQSAAFSGTAQDLGRQMRSGLQAAFAEANETGGLGGRALELLSLDDGYEPDRALENSQRLLDRGVFSLIGEVGTPTSRAVLPIVEERGALFFAPLSGAEFLRTPFRFSVVTIRASYQQELEQIVEYLVHQKNISRIACFYQNDSYGRDGLEGLRKALAKRGLQTVAEASYERNTVAVMGAMRRIDRALPGAVVLIGAYAPCAEFIKLSKNKSKLKPIFACPSFVGTESLQGALGAYGEGVIVSQVVPTPYGDSLPLVSQYREAMDRFQHDAKRSFTSFEGYIAGRLFLKVAAGATRPLTVATFLEYLETKGLFQLGGLELRFGPRDHQGSDAVFLTTIYPQIREVKDE